ncbi:MAG: undecaprenyl-diphosphate phosphatase, partial [Nitrososphaerota archaeon]
REIVAGFIRAGEGRGLLSFLIISTLSTAVTGLPLLLVIGHLPVPESVTTITIGSVLILMSLMGRVSGPPVENNLSGRKAFVAGLAQGLSIVPGVSRSGVTVIALLSQRLGLSTSLRLSFLMSIPATAAAQLALPIFVSTPELSPPSIISLLTATALGLLTIRTLLKISAHRSYTKVLTVLGVLAVLAGLVLLGGTL